MENYPIASPEVLLRLTNQGDAPFGVLLEDQSILEADAIVRRVQNSRLVVKAAWQGQVVYAKLFIGASAQRHATRDAAGIKMLMQAGIKTPTLLLESSAEYQHKNVQVLVFEEIKNAKTAEDLIKSSNEKARFALAQRLVQTIAFHHDADILHTDIHLNNFLIDDDFVYTLDGDGIKQYVALTYTPAWKNLGELISKFDILDQQKWLPELLKSYLSICPWHMPLTVEKLAALANAHRIKCANNYAKKVFRQCTDVNVRENLPALQGLFYVASSHAGLMLPENIAELDAFLTPENLLKNGNTCTVALAEIDAKKIVIKRYNIKSIWHGLNRALRPTRAAASWANAHRLKLLGIATALPIALIETKKLGLLGFNLRGKAYFLAEYIDAPDIAQYFANTSDKLKRAEAIKNIAELFYRLCLLQISHGDMKATNIKMLENKPVLIDLDSMSQHQLSFYAERAHIKDLKRFMRNWKDDASLYNAFVKTFKVVYPEHSVLQKAGLFDNKEIKD